MPDRSEIIEYLRENLSKFPVDALRRQLREEGVSDEDFEECLAFTLRSPKARTPVKQSPTPRKAAKTALALAAATVLGAGLLMLPWQASAPPETRPLTALSESGFVGHHGWVVHLPKDYVGMSELRDKDGTHQVVHFCKQGTDPTNLLNEGLFGQMGIVRLEVTPSPFPPNAAGAAALTNAATRKMSSRGEKFTLKNLTIGTLAGIQVNVQSPFPRVEVYVLGRNDLYFFYGGQEDEIWRDVVLSLRDPRSEN